MENIDLEAFKKAWLTDGEIEDTIEWEKEFEETWVAYDFDEAFLIIKNNLFASKGECIK